MRENDEMRSRAPDGRVLVPARGDEVCEVGMVGVFGDLGAQRVADHGHCHRRRAAKKDTLVVRACGGVVYVVHLMP